MAKRMLATGIITPVEESIFPDIRPQRTMIIFHRHESGSILLWCREPNEDPDEEL